MSESNRSVHSQGCNKTSEEAGLQGIVIGKGSIFLFSLLLLQSRLKQFFLKLYQLQKKPQTTHQENILELKYWGSVFLQKPTLKIWFGIFYFIFLWVLCHYFDVILK